MVSCRICLPPFCGSHMAIRCDFCWYIGHFQHGEGLGSSYTTRYDGKTRGRCANMADPNIMQLPRFVCNFETRETKRLTTIRMIYKSQGHTLIQSGL